MAIETGTRGMSGGFRLFFSIKRGVNAVRVSRGPGIDTKGCGFLRIETITKNGWTGWVLLIGLGPAALRADLLYFEQGGRVQLPATSSPDGTVRLDAPDGPVVFLRSDFRKVVPGYWPERDWPRRCAAARSGGAEARFAATWWALENGLTPQAVAMLGEAYAADPNHPTTARMMAALDRLGRTGAGEDTASDPDLGPIRRALGVSFEVARGPHVLLLHQHAEAEAAGRLELLERVVQSYYLLFAASGLELPVPGRRLVSAWFAEHRDYLAFLHAEGADAFRTTLGYYHPTLDVVLTYDARSGPAQRQARDAIAARLIEINRLAAGDRRDGLRREAERRQLLLEMERRSVELGTATHEMVHLLVAQSGLAPRHDDFPLWLHEGLAAQFEVVRGGRWAGFGRAHDLRLPDWRSLDSKPRLKPLLRDSGFGHGYRRDAYAAAWALVYYLRQKHPSRFVTFLDLLRTPDPEVRSREDRTVAHFHTSFGDDLDALEADWHSTLAALRTPLEEAL
jgi:uncharacterized protein DUF1570